PGAAALVARHSVVAEPGDHAPERLRALVEDRPAGVVLETREGLPGPRAVEEHVADHPRLARDRVQRQQPDPGKVGAGDIAVGTAEQLVAAADREERGAAFDRLPERVRLRDEIVG